MLRRNLLTSTALLTLAACAGQVPVPTTSPAPTLPPAPQPSWLIYVQAVLNGAEDLAPLLAQLGVGATVLGYLPAISGLARQLIANATSPNAGSLGQQLVADMEAMLGVLPAGLPTSVTMIVTALRVMLPVLSGALGLVSRVTASHAMPSDMTVGQALAVLRVR